VVLSVAFGALAALAVVAGADDLAVAVLQYLAVINLLLAVFNLLPAAPLDGGRLLRAALWKRRGDAASAAVTAARAGRFFGLVLVALGALQVASGAGVGGLWLALIGLFIVNAASAEEQQAVLVGRLGDLRVRSVMSSPAITVDPDENVQRFLHDVVLVRRFSTYPLVAGDGSFAGLVTLNRLRDLAPERRAVARLAEVACPAGEVAVAAPDERLVALLPRLGEAGDGRAVVVDGGRVVGVVSPSDVARALALSDLTVFDHTPPGGADVLRLPPDRQA
jgi:CBS domain-containing protein